MTQHKTTTEYLIALIGKKVHVTTSNSSHDGILAYVDEKCIKVVSGKVDEIEKKNLKHITIIWE